VLILLPPSEGKEVGNSSAGLNLDALSFSVELNQVRRDLLERYVDEIPTAPTAPAIDIYSGVLYKSLGYRSLPERARRKADSQLIVISALFGAIRPLDSIPRYTLKMKSSLWAPALSRALDDLEDELIVDCRSSTYLNAWKPDPSITVRIRVFQERDGVHSVITHMSKKYRGEFTRLLLQSREPKNPQDLLALAQKQFKAELHEPHGNHPWQLDLLVLSRQK